MKPAWLQDLSKQNVNFQSPDGRLEMRKFGSVSTQVLGESFCSNGQGKEPPQTDPGKSKSPLAECVAQRGMPLSILARVEMRWRKCPQEIFLVKRERIWCGTSSLMKKGKVNSGAFKAVQGIPWVCLWERSYFLQYLCSHLFAHLEYSQICHCKHFQCMHTSKLMGKRGQAAWGI